MNGLFMCYVGPYKDEETREVFDAYAKTEDIRWIEKAYKLSDSASSCVLSVLIDRDGDGIDFEWVQMTIRHDDIPKLIEFVKEQNDYEQEEPEG